MQALFDGVQVNDREAKAWTDAENRERRKKWRECAYNAVPNGKFPIVSRGRFLRSYHV
jgi:hypothetical protein